MELEGKLDMDLFKSREETIINFDQNYKSYLDSIDRDINKTLHLYSYLILKEPNYYLNEKAEYLILVIRSIDYLISATFLVRQRAIFEAGNIIRLCMETSAMAIHINDNTKEFIYYKQGNYKSTMAINFAERHIKKFGEIWGVLSKLMVHPNTFHGISSIMERGVSAD